jgi:hypothetical protein
MKKTSFIVLIFISFAMSAQITPIQGTEFNYVEANPDEKPVEGTRYFYDDRYHDGELVLKDKKRFTKPIKYRFDQLEGSVQVLLSDGKELLLEDSTVFSLQLYVSDDKVVSFINTKLPNFEKPRILQIIYQTPKMRLLRDVRKKIMKKMYIGQSASNVPDDKLIKDYTYYFAEKGAPLVKIKPNEKGFIKVLPHKKKEIERLFELTKFKKELTVSKLVELMQKLEEEKKMTP